MGQNLGVVRTLLLEEVNLFWHKKIKDFFFDTAEPDLNFDGDKAVYIGDVSHS